MNLLHIAFKIAAPKNAPAYMPNDFNELDEEFQELFKIMFNFSDSKNSTQKDYEEYFKTFPKDLFKDMPENGLKEILEQKIEDSGLSDMIGKNIKTIKDKPKKFKDTTQIRYLSIELRNKFEELVGLDERFRFFFDLNRSGNSKGKIITIEYYKKPVLKILGKYKKYIRNIIIKPYVEAGGKISKDYIYINFTFQNVDLDEISL